MSLALKGKGSVVFVLMLGVMGVVGALSLNIYLPAMPAIAESLQSGIASVQATVATFMIGLASGQLLWGSISDRIGRRAPLLVGLVLYIAASTACALARSIDLLIAVRFVQGFAASVGIVLARAIVSDRFAGHDAAIVFSWQHLIIGMAPIFAPLIGAGLLRFVGWRSIFWLLSAVGLLLLIVLWKVLRESRSTEAAEHARNEGRLKAYRAVLGNPQVFAHLISGAFAASGITIWYSGASPLFQETFGWSTTVASWTFAAMGVVIVAATQINRPLLRFKTPRRVLDMALLGGGAAAAGTCLLALSNAVPHGFVAGGLILSVSTFGMVSANNQACTLHLDRMRGGSISALQGASVYGVGALFAWLVSRVPPANGASMAAMTATNFATAWLILRRLSPIERIVASPSAVL
jgi:DHA1 family bicyclomycin/chloramphenicol resistance-like MFS transporter